jgi:hypothetical protein
VKLEIQQGNERADRLEAVQEYDGVLAEAQSAVHNEAEGSRQKRPAYL